MHWRCVGTFGKEHWAAQKKAEEEKAQGSA
jgi:hypothetical protein